MSKVYVMEWSDGLGCSVKGVYSSVEKAILGAQEMFEGYSYNPIRYSDVRQDHTGVWTLALDSYAWLEITEYDVDDNIANRQEGTVGTDQSGSGGGEPR